MSYRISNLNIFGQFVFEILAKILLGALRLWLSIYYILKKLKYATHTNSAVTSVFDVLVKFLLEMSCRLLVTCDKMRKRHFIDNI